MPICANDHWFLLVIVLGSDNDEFSGIICLDSKPKWQDGKTIPREEMISMCSHIRSWLNLVHPCNKSFNEDNFPVIQPEGMLFDSKALTCHYVYLLTPQMIVPEQLNSIDCGLYMLSFIIRMMNYTAFMKSCVSKGDFNK